MAKINVQALLQNPLAVALAKGLAYTENGGKVDLANTKAGKTGEMKSIYQFTPPTWKNYAQQVFGDPNTPMTNDNETYVVLHKVNGWLKEGYTPEQIASMWNAGTGEPNAYTGKFSNGTSSKGINKKYGVAFDVPTYAKKVTKYTNQFLSEQKAERQDTSTFKSLNAQTSPTVVNPQSSYDAGKYLTTPKETLLKGTQASATSMSAPSASNIVPKILGIDVPAKETPQATQPDGKLEGKGIIQKLLGIA